MIDLSLEPPLWHFSLLEEIFNIWMFLFEYFTLGIGKSGLTRESALKDQFSSFKKYSHDFLWGSHKKPTPPATLLTIVAIFKLSEHIIRICFETFLLGKTFKG